MSLTSLLLLFVCLLWEGRVEGGSRHEKSQWSGYEALLIILKKGETMRHGHALCEQIADYVKSMEPSQCQECVVELGITISYFGLLPALQNLG